MFTTKVRVWSDFCGPGPGRSSIRSGFGLIFDIFSPDFLEALLKGVLKKN